MQYFGPPPPAAAQPQPVRFLIALKNGTVNVAIAYWAEDGTLHYINEQGQRVDVPTSQVDRARSQQLNSDRGVAFGLPDTAGTPRTG